MMRQTAIAELLSKYPPEIQEVILQTLEVEYELQSYKSPPAIYERLMEIIEKVRQKDETELD